MMVTRTLALTLQELLLINSDLEAHADKVIMILSKGLRCFQRCEPWQEKMRKRQVIPRFFLSNVLLYKDAGVLVWLDMLAGKWEGI